MDAELRRRDQNLEDALKQRDEEWQSDRVGEKGIRREMGCMVLKARDKGKWSVWS